MTVGSAGWAGALTGGYLALLARGAPLVQAVTDGARAAWGADATGDAGASLTATASTLLMQSGFILGAVALGALAAGWARARFVPLSDDDAVAPPRWLGALVALAALVAGAVQFRRLLVLLSQHHAPALLRAALVGELRWFGAVAVLLAWAAVLVEVVLAFRRGPSARSPEDDREAARHADQSAERRRRRAEVLQPGP